MHYRRVLFPSEAMFAANRSTVAYSVFGTGTLDRDALATAFAALLRAYPVLAGRLVAEGPRWLLEPAPQPPPLRTSAETTIPVDGFAVVGDDAVSAIDVAQIGSEFRLTLLTHHSIADAKASLRYLERLCDFYTNVVESGSAGPVVAHPLPQSLEQLLATSDFSVRADPIAVPPRAKPDNATAEVARVWHGRTRLGCEDTTALFDAARRHGVTVHGVVSAAILLAARELSLLSEPVVFALVSSVDLRTRVGKPVAAEAGTVIQGLDSAVVTVAREDDPLRLARAVNDSLRTNLANRRVHQAFLRQHDIRPQTDANPLMVTNWGRIPTLHLPRGVRAHDFRASASGSRMRRARSSPPSFFVTTYEGRLSIDHPAWVTDGSEPTAAWSAALEDALRRIARRAVAE